MTAPEQSRVARVRALRAPEDSETIVLLISGTITRAAIPELCERVRAFLARRENDTVVCDLGGVIDPDAATIDALSRMQLTARRLGCVVRVDHASEELRDLIAMMGLADVVPLCEVSVLEAEGQSEHREEPRRVEEERDP